jgi:hypothetical protein
LIGLDDQRVIIFGGNDETEGIDNFRIANEDSLYVLSTSNLEWYIPKISGKIPSNRRYHSANVIGKYMIISFGKYNTIKRFKIIMI